LIQSPLGLLEHLVTGNREQGPKHHAECVFHGDKLPQPGSKLLMWQEAAPTTIDIGGSFLEENTALSAIDDVRPGFF
jgi:hypothetical protein